MYFNSLLLDSSLPASVATSQKAAFGAAIAVLFVYSWLRGTESTKNILSSESRFDHQPFAELTVSSRKCLWIASHCHDPNTSEKVKRELATMPDHGCNRPVRP